ncbi:DUF4430 domain-containing protein [Paenibacillus sp. IB182496]|uniref:DUF4430 domain-containing protein n=2 Tax=Paenibacillus sabuli TaxID=2772509 RepID=A0A927BU33_9BACL|nr:DUF4430 domain-containing protein [Paenibacillus sabuli]
MDAGSTADPQRAGERSDGVPAAGASGEASDGERPAAGEAPASDEAGADAPGADAPEPESSAPADAASESSESAAPAIPTESSGAVSASEEEPSAAVPAAESPPVEEAPDTGAEPGRGEPAAPGRPASEPPSSGGLEPERPAAPQPDDAAAPPSEQSPAAGQEDNQTEPQTQASAGDKDRYLTDPVPEGKPEPVEWQEVEVDKAKARTATLSVTAKTILNNLDLLDEDKLEVLPGDGVIYAEQTVTFYEGESVFDVLLREMKASKIHMEFEMTPIYNSHYVEGIHNLYEFDCGELSGWMYKVNDWFPNYGASRYQLEPGDRIEWVYTCDLGRDIGGSAVAGGR